MSDVRTFRAATMREALDLVRQELGSDALILHTRQVSRRRFLPWRKPIRHVEVTASLDFPPGTKPSASGRTTGKRSARTTTRGAGTENASTGAGNSSTPTRRPDAEKKPPAASQSSAPPGNSKPALPSSQEGVTFERTTTDADVASASASLKHARRFHGNGPSAGARAQQSAGHSQPSAKEVAPPASAGWGSDPKGWSADERSAGHRPEVGRHQPLAADPSEFATKLDSIQRMLEQLGQSGLSHHGGDIPGELFQLYTHLIDAEVDDSIARELMTRLKSTASPEQLQDPEAALSVLTAMVENEVSCCGPIVPSPGKRKVVALVGSTGVGKTTTIAKLAANFRLRDGVKMGLVTVDTYRIAAVEQLRTYAEIIDLPMKVVTNPLEMRRVMDELVGLDLILIDTAGRSPRDELQIKELKSLLAEASVDEVHLVLNLTASPKMLQATADRFSAVGATSLIMTKLDEAAGMGALLSVARNVALPFSYLTTGQDVPDDIEPANATRMARLILGREKIG